MLIWILAVLLVAGLGYVGYAQGAIRVAFSLLGILAGWLAAVPLSVRVAPFLKKMGINDPGLPVLFGGVVVFILVSALFKAMAFYVHQKIETHYKYRASETHLMLWERLNQRTGACLAMVNATLYLALIAGVIYGFGYWTVQMAQPEGDPFTLRTLNSAARGLQSSGFVRTAGAVAPMNQAFYDTADLAGLLYVNPAAQEKLSRYPAFISLAERPEYQAIAQNEDLRGMRQKGESLARFLAQPLVENVMTNKDLLGELETIVSRDLTDLTGFIQTGRSVKYADEKLVGRWRFTANGTLAQIKATRPDLTSKEMLSLRLSLQYRYSQAVIIVAPDGQLFLKSIASATPGDAPGGTPGLTNQKGQWEETAGSYKITIEGDTGGTKGKIEDGRLILSQGGMVLAFNRQP